MAKSANAVNKTAEVDEFMAQREHPHKDAVQLLRTAIKAVNPGIIEQIKWNAPSFAFQGEYLCTFNLHTDSRVHLVFHNPFIVQIDSDLLEGEYRDRRMAYFANLAEAKKRKPELQRIVKQLVNKIDQK
jgi:uncharacterized protein YdhG (YjbR/CyaY superfamily)